MSLNAQRWIDNCQIFLSLPRGGDGSACDFPISCGAWEQRHDVQKGLPSVARRIITAGKKGKQFKEVNKEQANGGNEIFQRHGRQCGLTETNLERRCSVNLLMKVCDVVVVVITVSLNKRELFFFVFFNLMMQTKENVIVTMKSNQLCLKKKEEKKKRPELIFRLVRLKTSHPG